MNLKNISNNKNDLGNLFEGKSDDKKVICLVGNPNTGKSSIFNSLTGLNQHTGNWSGKTVSSATGSYEYNNKKYNVIDLPGVYSILSGSKEEEVTREFVCFGKYDLVVVVCDITSLERNLNILLETLEINKNVVLCLNFSDEAEKKKILLKQDVLKRELKIPIVVVSARYNRGILELKETVYKAINNDIKFLYEQFKYDTYIEERLAILEDKFNIKGMNKRWACLRILDKEESFFDFTKQYLDEQEYGELINLKREFKGEDTYKNRESILNSLHERSLDIKLRSIVEKSDKHYRDRKIDDIVTSKRYGIPIMICALAVILFLTINFSNIPSGMLADMFLYLEKQLSSFLMFLNFPIFLHDMIVYGFFRVTGWVISVMLPPMAIFFPLFTFFEDLGYLPRVAFNLDHLFKKAGCHGKQSLSMCMGFGCNCSGIIGTRIIESKRERLIAILTNNFVPCNGRFPTMILLSTIFFSTTSNMFLNSIITSLVVTLIIIIGVLFTLLVSHLLAKTFLKGESSSFSLELPPYRKPKLKNILYNSLINRTIKVLGRAVMVAAPFGVLIWILANTFIGDMSIIDHLVKMLNPIGVLIGLDGAILLAFLLGFPANEIVMPILLMCYLSTGTLVDFESTQELSKILISNGWTIFTAINMMLFSLLHFPCSTAVLTMKKETGSYKWTALGVLIPTLIAFLVCFIVNLIVKLLFI